MKEKADLVKGWLRKASSDLVAMEASRQAGALDACCFHAQQAVEKLLKAFLVYHDVDFPFTHNLARLLKLATDADAACRALEEAARTLTPYAVELRYDHEFWPDSASAEEACSLAGNSWDLLTGRLPEEFAGSTPGPPEDT